MIIHNITGWMSRPELFFLYEAARKMNSVVELGSYLGRSAAALASGCEGTVYCVDLWESIEGCIDMEGTEYDQFLENVKDFKNIEVIKKSTLDAVKDIGEVDMVFIDADHSYEAVSADIKAWLPKTKKVICGHDYDFKSVRKAVDELIDIDGHIDSIWYKLL